MAVNRINARSPYIIQVDEYLQKGSKLMIYIWNGTGSAPAYPTHVVSKLSPSTTQTANEYNISPYVREFLNHNTHQQPLTTLPITDTKQWCNVKVKRYRFNGTSYYLLDEILYRGYQGYGYYEDGYNPDNGDVMLKGEQNYYYWYSPDNDPTTDLNIRSGHVTMENGSGYSVEWENLVSGANETTPTGLTPMVDVPRVFPSYYADGNILRIKYLGTTIWKAKFIPVQECRYTPITLDFVNKYGAWQREFMFKASYNDFEVQTQSYNLMQTEAVAYSPTEGQFKDFNINGRETIKVNTGLIKENMNDTIQQIYLSERIMLDGRPVQLKKKSESKLKDINTRIRNYTLEFVYANEIINSVI